MRIEQVEDLARKAIRRAKEGKPCESSQVEFKSCWTDEKSLRKAARQLAGFANAARRLPVIWIIGVEEVSGNVTGADATETANWWPKVMSHFDSVAPSMQHNAPFEIDGHTVVALSFDTARPPYIVKTAENQQAEREIPWREGNITRTAFRHEILSLLIEQASLPRFELLDSELMSGPLQNDQNRHVLAFSIVIYAERIERRLHAPHHRRTVIASFPKSDLPPVEFGRCQAIDLRQTSPNISVEGSQIAFDGPGIFKLDGSAPAPFTSTLPREILLEIRMHFGEIDDQVLVSETRFVEPSRSGRNPIRKIDQKEFSAQFNWTLLRDE